MRKRMRRRDWQKSHESSKRRVKALSERLQSSKKYGNLAQSSSSGQMDNLNTPMS